MPDNDVPVTSPGEDIQMLVGRRIRAARLARGMTLAELGGTDLSRSFLSSVEHGRSSISLRALARVARRLRLPVSYFVDSAPPLDAPPPHSVDQAEAALAYSELLRRRGATEKALEYALWAAQVTLERMRSA